MKKLLAIFMCIIFVFTFAACGTQNEDNDSNTQTDTQSEQTEAPSEDTQSADNADDTENEATDAPSAENKTLVAYFSASGNTKAIAEYIAAATDADIFEITPAEIYTSDDLNWTDNNSRVSQEHNDESLRNVELTTTDVPNWDSYDTVFIGYPIWWGIAAWPTSSFVKANDFTGKTVIPFCTSSSSGLGQSGELLAESAGTGDWQEGQRFQSRASEQDVQDWVAGLGL